MKQLHNSESHRKKAQCKPTSRAPHGQSSLIKASTTCPKQPKTSRRQILKNARTSILERTEGHPHILHLYLRRGWLSIRRTELHTRVIGISLHEPVATILLLRIIMIVIIIVILIVVIIFIVVITIIVIIVVIIIMIAVNMFIFVIITVIIVINIIMIIVITIISIIIIITIRAMTLLILLQAMLL